MNKIESFYTQFVQNCEDHSLMRQLVDIERPEGLNIRVDGQDYINFSSNDYLGLSQHPELIERSREWAASYGAGASASRLVTGNLDVFTKIEDKLAKFKGKEAALIMASGYQANASVLPALFDKKILVAEPLVFSDKLNHASMHTGCAAAGVSQIRYRHNDMDHLKELLEKHVKNESPKFILTESVFSMDGDIAPLDEIDALAKQYDCFVIIDEAHAMGVLGNNGSGLAHKADLVIGTFSKAFGSFGAYIACSTVLKKYLINKCSGLIYSTALPPSVLGSIDAALDLVPAMDKERMYLQNVSQNFRNKISSLGFDVGQSKTQIVPMVIGDANEALKLSDTIKSQGFWATAIRPPTVPQNSARIRFAFSANHEQNDVDALINVLKNYNLKQAA